MFWELKCFFVLDSLLLSRCECIISFCLSANRWLSTIFNRGQAEKEFKVEVEAIGRVRHKNLVRLFGYCVEGAYRYRYLFSA